MGYLEGYFYLVIFKFIWGSFSIILSKWLVTRIQLVVQRNELKLGFVEHIWGNLTFESSMSFLSFGALRLKMPYNSKTGGRAYVTNIKLKIVTGNTYGIFDLVTNDLVTSKFIWVYLVQLCQCSLLLENGWA